LSLVGFAVMSRMLSCPRGHQWEAVDDRSAPGDSAHCPVCGAAAGQPIEDGSPTSPSPSNTPTILLPEPWQPMPPLNAQPPPKLPDFEIQGELGRGGMGVVYKARHLPDDRIVALKVIRKERLLDEESVRRFRREAQAAARACHENIVRVYDSDHSGDTHYLMMEYVDGATLQRLVDEHGPLPVAQACDFIRQAAEGLQHAHEQALVHRDIKPSNLMVTGATPQAAGLVKILDLGVARLLRPMGVLPGESLSTLTQGGAVIGTADYIAPEQLEDPHGADIRADLYSLGCTFYYLLTGRVPFPGGTLISKLDKQRWQTAEPVVSLREEVPQAVASVVQKLMAKRPADRFQSPGELARVLRALARTGYRGPDGASLFTMRMRTRGHADVVWSVAFSPDALRFASAGKDGGVVVWDSAAGTQVRALPRHAQEVRAVAFVDSERLASASGLTVRLWDIATGQELRRFSGHTAAVRSLVPFDEGRRLASGGEDRLIRVWDVQTGREVLRHGDHTAGVTCLAAVPGDVPCVLSGGRDQTLRLWDARNGHDLRVLAGNRGVVLGLAVAPDGRHAASGHFDTIVRLWDLATGSELRRCEGHRQMVTSLAFTNDGHWLISVSQDQTIRLWDVETACELSCVQAQSGGINAVAVSPDARQVLVAGSDGSVSIHEVAL
jgi:tRNA A-37 threonylcarbamoyl transferase component Bud32